LEVEEPAVLPLLTVLTDRSEVEEILMNPRPSKKVEVEKSSEGNLRRSSSPPRGRMNPRPS
jgi:hypothetical protein